MIVWSKDGKVLYHEFSTLYPIAGFALEYKEEGLFEKGRWTFSPDTRNVAVVIGNLLVDEKMNILLPECYTFESLLSDIKYDKKEYGEQTGLSYYIKTTNTNFEDVGGRSLELDKWYDTNPIIDVYSKLLDNRFVKVKTNVKIDRGKLAELPCNNVFIEDNACYYFFFQDWISEKTCVLWAYKENYEGIPENEDDQVKDLVYIIKHLLSSYQYKLVMPSDEISNIDNPEIVDIKSDKFKDIMCRAFPRPWWVAAWSPKEKRNTDKYISIYREITLSMYKHYKDMIPKPLRVLNKPTVDLSEFIKNWDVDTSSSLNAIKSVWEEFHNNIIIDQNESRKNVVEVFRDGKAHPYDAANAVSEVLRQVDKVFGASWAGGGIPCKPTVLDPVSEKPRAAVKAYVVENDDWVISEIGMSFGECGSFEQKIEHLLI